ncbi:Separin-like protein [Cladobotryum mycophilum]|uniref:separase n=1 Tax=Cladobotryum mycophilum TaxID=491253 RepID=A0ABR0SAE6_9HYPO
MASLQAKIDAVKASIISTSTCTPTTVVTLKELLLPEPESQPPRPKSSAGRATKTPTLSRTKSSVGREKAGGNSQGELGAREKTALATQVINVTLKSLTEATKPPPPSTPSKQYGDLRQVAGKRALRRSSSAPLSPIHPRALNRVTTSPNVAQNQAKPVSAAQSTGCLATVECARVAFTCLRSIKGPIQPDQTDFQLENGMSALVGKLVTLGMHEQALKELRVLKRRLDGAEGKEASNAKNAESNSAVVVIGDLLKFHGKISKNSLSTITGYQMHVLKLVAAIKKSSYIEAILPHLRDSDPASPLNLLLILAKDGEKEAAKVARQMASMSQVLLSLAPSISSQEDIVATEPRLSPSPSAAFEIQSLAFRTQMKWWKMAGHKGNIDDDVLSPFSRCVRAFVRRHKAADISIYKTIVKSFDGLMEPIRAQKYRPSISFNSPLASIHQILGSVAQTERYYDEAYRWFQELKKSLTPGQDSSVRTCSVSARLLAVALKKTGVVPGIEQLIQEVIEGLDGSLSGTVAELNELLESLALTRRSVVGMLMNIIGPNAKKDSSSSSLGGLLKTFILRYPRFIRRWMGLPPAKDAAPKQLLQFDQRRQLVLQSVNQVLDATLMVVKCDLQSNTSEWQPMDDVLQHCHSLLESLSTSTLSVSKTENLGAYRVKISSLYFSVFLQIRKKTDRSKEENKQLLVALNRSIESVKECTAAEKEKSQLSTKLELFADLCKGAGRTEDAVRTLRSICTNMAEDGALSDVATALASQPPTLAWNVTDKASIMSRTLRSIAKLDKSWNDWTFFLPETERAAVLEHLIHISSSGASASSQPLRLHDPGMAGLLRIYTTEKYPIRRLRVLLHLFYQNLGEADQADEIASLVDQTFEQLQKKDKSEDVSLAHFVPHLQAYYSSISTLLDTEEKFPASTVADAVASWKSMVEKCQTQDEIFAKIDDPQSLLDHLRSLNQLAGLKGENRLQLSIVELSIAISRLYMGCAESIGDALVLNYSQLAAQYVNIGLFPQALRTLEETEALVAQYDGVSRRVLADLYISQAEYYTGVGNMDTATAYLSKASSICSDPYSSWAQSKSQATMMLSMASLLQSIVTLETGDIQDALNSIKTSVRMLSHDWSKLETTSMNASISSELSISDVSTGNAELKTTTARVVGPRYWNLASPLLRSLLHISSVYAHIGMFQETIYYAESAWKIAESTQSSLYKAQVSAWTGSIYLKASKIPKALGYFKHAEDQLPHDVSASRVRFARQIGEFYWEIGEDVKAAQFLKTAEETAHLLSRNENQSITPIPAEASEEAVVKGRGVAVSRTTRTTRAARPKTPVAPKPQKRGVAAKAKPPPPTDLEQWPKDIYQASLFAAIMISRTLGMIHQKDWASALTALEQVKNLPKLTGILSQEQVITAISLIGHSMEQMILDPVFSVMQDSTISFPAVSVSPDKGQSDITSPVKSPPRKGRAASRKTTKENSAPAFADALRQAQELLMEAHSSALSSSDSSMVRRISTLLQSTIIFLSATSTKSTALSHGLATVAVDMARNVTWRREQQTLATIENVRGPQTSNTAPKPNLEFTADMAKFQKQYVDLVPKKWSVISMSLSDNRHDLCITKFQAGHSPFILRLPLERANSRDADSEVFNFAHGREELLDIIRLANESSHSARDFTAKGERGAWWAEREALDTRLKDLLMTVETTWLGGFKGIFSQHRRRSDLLARFQKNFHQMLDRILPSRNRVRGKTSTKTGSVTLDPRILDLFIGLGDPTDPDCDFDEALNDLLYFVVDILQFHGERNAYDEIDFDAMVVETYDALRGYHDATKSAGEREDSAHTVLVLDKALHAFPWESLPCMDGLAVSRVPSLAALKQLIVDAKGSIHKATADAPQGHYVSPDSGTYILNPSSDLKNTQSFFQPAFSALESWTSIVDRAPDENDFERALSTSDVVVYFGHGSGAQYIRGKTIRRLEKCKPATFLMGCSSAALTEAGDFECYGPVWNYMMAGCPAVVGTLWDVTDRDIDRFAGRAFEEWGLFAKGTFNGDVKGKGKSKSRCEDDDESDSDEDGSNDLKHASLAEAVARARNACRFKYLNAAAVVMYGIPVYINKKEG